MPAIHPAAANPALFVDPVVVMFHPVERILEDDRNGFYAARDDLDVVHLVAGLAAFFRAVDRGVDNQAVGRFHGRHLERYFGPRLRSCRYRRFVGREGDIGRQRIAIRIAFEVGVGDVLRHDADPDDRLVNGEDGAVGIGLVPVAEAERDAHIRRLAQSAQFRRHEESGLRGGTQFDVTRIFVGAKSVPAAHPAVGPEGVAVGVEDIGRAARVGIGQGIRYGIGSDGAADARRTQSVCFEQVVAAPFQPVETHRDQCTRRGGLRGGRALSRKT